MPVEPKDRVLYLASDRPRQILRSLRRHVGPEHRAQLKDRLVIWKGPPPVDLAQDPERLLLMAQEAGATVVVLDSLKDMATGITEDKVGAGLNRAIQLAVAAGIEVLALHHQRKGQNGEKPKTLEDVYGSTWLTAGMGSVVLLWGTAGDPEVEVVHLKQPGEVIGPLKVEHDHQAGRSTLAGGSWNPLAYLCHIHPQGCTTKEAGHAWLNRAPVRAEQMRAQRRLEALVKEGLAEVSRPGRGGAVDGRKGSVSAAYRATQKGLQINHEINHGGSS
jgi:replicative DNA helicase